LKTPPSKHKLKTSSPQRSLAMFSLFANPTNRRKTYNAKEISFMKKIFEIFLTSKTTLPKMSYVNEVFTKTKTFFRRDAHLLHYMHGFKTKETKIDEVVKLAF
jgi:hypothetical protein